MKKRSTVSTDDTNSKIAILSAWVICIAIILLSYQPFLNIVAKAVLMVFVIWFVFKILTDLKSIHWPNFLLWYLAFGMFALLPSAFAPKPDWALFKWFAITFIGLTNIVIANLVVWSGSVRPWIWAYLFASIASYYLPLNYLPLFNYDTEVNGRHVGTLVNANTYGCNLVQAALLTLLLLIQEKRLFFRMILLVSIVILTIEVLGSGSRTSLIGLILAFSGAAYSVGINSLLKPRNLLFLSLSLIGSFVTILTGFALSQSENFSMILERMSFLLVYLGLIDGAAVVKERSLYGRMDLLKQAFDTWLQYPLGVGLDNFKVITGGPYAHSNYLELLASVGLIGLIMYYFCYFKFYKQVKRLAVNRETVAVKKMLVISIVILAAMDASHVAYYSKTFWLFMSILAGYLILIERDNKPKTTELKRSRVRKTSGL